MKISTPAFADKGKIPEKFAYEKGNISPNLKFTDVPENAKTIALIVDDPDAPRGTFVHWVAWNIPGSTRELKEGDIVQHQGVNSYREMRYSGPNPPQGDKPHRYFFKAYALDADLKIPDGSTKQDLEKAMQGHILEEAEMIGTYQK